MRQIEHGLSAGNRTLFSRLAEELQEDFKLTFHHLSTSPEESSAIFAAAPGHESEPTVLESHFLSGSIDLSGKDVQVLAIEVLIYTTDRLTTLFVSKADSTGYLHLAKDSHEHGSPIRAIARAFLEWLLEKYTKPDRTTLLSLFARAQDQYLFPGSIENSYKHVLDDRELIRWWCKVVDPLLDMEEDCWERTGTGKRLKQGYLRVPGYDTHGTRSFFPKARTTSATQSERWKVGDPLQIIHSTGLPERCLVPRFPDDPKARFVVDLDDELLQKESGETSLQDEKLHTPNNVHSGRWRSVRSLDQFWEMMSFRQECSAGRLVGFFWALSVPYGAHESNKRQSESDVSNQHGLNDLLTTASFQAGGNEQTLSLSSPTIDAPPAPISAAQQADISVLKTGQSDDASDLKEKLPENVPHTTDPSSPAEVILTAKDYQSTIDLLLQLDYANLQVATESTAKWIEDVARKKGYQSWGIVVEGRKKAPSVLMNANTNNSTPTLLNPGLVKKKKKRPLSEGTMEAQLDAVNTLSGCLVRKKNKIRIDDIASAEEPAA